MAVIYDRFGGKKFTKRLAEMVGVQRALDEVMFEIAVRAEELLVQHRADGHAEIDVDAGTVDRYVILSDERGQKAALSIEFGRQASVAVREDKDGNKFLVMIPPAEGLFILARAAGLPKKRKGKVKL
ncbi:DUF5403 family protein [Kitasatospora sp. NPDC057940]|uniref:DUF5403 family protein n=1 Tax=Kitasatospora sp. NPDC057940 TaxID=3346285 RepID=UPI0036DA67D1